MSSLFIKFIPDKQGLGNCKFKFNEKTVLISDIEELEKLFNIFLKHIRSAYEILNLDINDRLSIIANEVNKEFQEFRDMLGHIKTEEEKRINLKNWEDKF